MRLIDAEKLEKYKADCCVPLTEWQEGWNDAIDTIIDETPTVDAEPVRHGKWIIKNDDFMNYPTVCSVCGMGAITSAWRPIKTPYCPNCGAKMDEKINNRKE